MAALDVFNLIMQMLKDKTMSCTFLSDKTILLSCVHISQRRAKENETIQSHVVVKPIVQLIGLEGCVVLWGDDGKGTMNQVRLSKI